MTIRTYDVPLLVLTVGAGAIDAVSFLALDQVFTGNMTGNVLLIGFGLAGAPDIPVLNNVLALLAFMLGAVLTGRLTARATGRAKLSRSALAVLAGGTTLTFALAGFWTAVDAPGGVAALITTGLLAVVLGAQAAVARQIGIRDLSTVVITSTLVNLSADSRIAGGTGKAWPRRVGAVVALGSGALVAAILILWVSGSAALLAAGVALAIGTALAAGVRRRELAAPSGTDVGGTGPAAGRPG
ncbi:YoaK family protein [Micromonospora sp. WMMD1082]|uniref:YoaK family protein n=1 Tax=Micromonospora sp. WMMD1082 TaxID=3016104 RepID=UPI0024180B51|nr:YoaK family protein [Micromonospora sp. WMMD1082]MDG4797146.1 YoaK family protein [Micromonospora sp. WMMD1082]